MSDISTASSTIIRRFWIADVIVLVIFLSTAAYGIFLFRQDLMQTIESRGAPAVGIIVIKNNVVQRRYEDRTIWERLFVDSPVYSGDLVRAAELSDATIHIDDHQIALNENTLIRIQRAAGEDWAFEVELREGNLSVSSASGADEGFQTGLMLNLMGKQVQLASGTMLSAEIGEEGLVVKVNEGSAVFIEDGQEREIIEGEMISQDKDGKEKPIPAAVVTSVKPNAHYLKTSVQSLGIDFNWTTINIEKNENVRLEIASDKKFTRDHRILASLYNHAFASFNAGIWFWRLSLAPEGTVLGSGQITVVDASGPELASPVDLTVFRYFSSLPKIRFQWEKKSGASNYIVEICRDKDFEEVQIERQSEASSFIQSELESGIWYWRVLPVFPEIYQGSAEYSPIASFKIEKTEDPHASAIEISETVLAVKTASSRTASSRTAAGNTATSSTATSNTATSSTATSSTVTSSATTSSPTTSSPTTSSPVRDIAIGSYYTVVSGDTLGRIAGRAYGNPYLWPRISDANKLENPDLILVDQVLLIP